MAVIVTFQHIGRNHHVPPLRLAERTLAPDQASLIADAVDHYAAGRLFSRDHWVTVDLEACTGTILAGFRVAGTFTLREDDTRPGEPEQHVPSSLGLVNKESGEPIARKDPQ